MAVSEKQKANVKKYKAKKDTCMVYFPAGTAEAVRGQGVSVSGLCCELVAAWLAERGVKIPEIKPAQPVKVSAVDRSGVFADNIRGMPEPVRGAGEQHIQAESVPGAGEPVRADTQPDIIDMDMSVEPGRDPVQMDSTPDIKPTSGSSADPVVSVPGSASDGAVSGASGADIGVASYESNQSSADYPPIIDIDTFLW